MKKAVFLVIVFLVLESCVAKIGNQVSPPPSPPPPPPPAPTQVDTLTTISAQISTNLNNMQMPAPIDRGVLMAADRGVLMKNGTVMAVKDGQLIPITKTVTLENGDKVMPNGNIIHEDGTQEKMKEGMIMNKSGVILDKTGTPVDAGMSESIEN